MDHYYFQVCRTCISIPRTPHPWSLVTSTSQSPLSLLYSYSLCMSNLRYERAEYSSGCTLKLDFSVYSRGCGSTQRTDFLYTRFTERSSFPRPQAIFEMSRGSCSSGESSKGPVRRDHKLRETEGMYVRGARRRRTSTTRVNIEFRQTRRLSHSYPTLLTIIASSA